MAVAAWLGLWAAQIVLSVYIYLYVPKEEGITQKAAGIRQSAIVGGFLPCAGLMLFFQIPGLIRYRRAVDREHAERDALQADLTSTDFDDDPSDRSSSDSSPSTNPAEDEPKPPRDSSPESDNPFR